MTNEEKAAYIAKARPIWQAFMKKTVNWPDCTNAAMMNQIGPLWAEFVSQGLVLEGMTFPMFVEHAHNKYMEAEMRRIMGI
jgi:hypothetical protein